MEKLTRKLAHVTGTQNAILSNKYANAVVRGYTHTVRELLGHLDVRTTAEVLQDAKDSVRESALSSLFTASSVYPVQMQSADWFEALDTGFTREDLSQSPDLLEAVIHSKSTQIDNLESQLANLRGFQVGDPEKAERAVKLAAQEQSEALGKLSSTYTANTISAVKLAIAAVEASTPAGAASSSLKAAIEAKPGQKDKLQKVLGPDYGKLDEIGEQVNAVTAANQKVNAASRQLTELMSAASLAKAGDTHIQVENTQRALTVARQELQDMSESYAIAIQAQVQRTSDKDKKAADVGQIPAGNGGSRWVDLTVHSAVTSEASSTVSASSSSVSSVSCNFWLGSYSKSSHTLSALNVSEANKSELVVDVSMRVTYVTVDRSGWFDPSFAEMSGAFMHSYQGAKYQSWCKWKIKEDDPKYKNDSKYKGRSLSSILAQEISEGTTENIEAGYLSAFPVGYILVKDCVIQVTSSNFANADKKKAFEEGNESSGGFLCFSTSSASHKQSDSSQSASTTTSDGMVIRIPGPQFLGYMMQLMAPDDSNDFVKMPTDYLFDEMKRIDDEDKKSSSSEPAHGVQDEDDAGNDKAADSSNKKRGVRPYHASGMFRERDSGAVQGKAGSGRAASIDPNASAADADSKEEKNIGIFVEALHKAVSEHSSMKGKSEKEKQDWLDLFKDALSKAIPS
ncbi:hypothetical protein NDA16_003701 [Ustilago loliicola]|nr:hypothetical protein NDA16_003701 [Ustilago loliicola]